MPMNDGAMQSFALTLEKFLTHAAKWHSSAEVVTGREGGRVDRVSYAELERRSRKVSVVLDGMGIRQGDRVATLAWNTQAHVEAWYAIMGMGAICHTLNPRGNAEFDVYRPGFFGTSGTYSFENESQMFKVPQLRNLYQKVGMRISRPC